MHIDHVGLVASDPERTIAFYCSLLDGSLEVRAGHTVVQAGEIRIAISPSVPTEPRPRQFARGEHLALRLPQAIEKIMLNRVAELPHETVNGRVYVTDPDGFVVELVFEPSAPK